MTRSRRARLWGCGVVLAAGLGWWTSPGRCGTVSFNPQGMAVLAAAAAPGQRVEVGRVYFDSYRRNLYAGLPAWDLFMQPASDRLQGDLGDLPLSRLTWSLVRYPGYTTVVPPTPLGPGNVHVARIQWGGMHEMRWWFEPQPWDTAGAEPYTVPILYTVSVTDVDARAFVYLAFPNPFDPDAGQPLRVWVRYGQWAEDQGITSVTAILGVVPSNRPFEAGGSEPYCTASAVYSYGTTLSLVNRSQPPWIHPDWFEMTWDGRTTAGQPVPDGDYCLAILFSPPGAAVVEVPLRVARSGRAGTALRVQVVQSAGGQPVENATVHVAGPGGVEGRQLVTGPDGVAVVQGLARERYLVWADAPGYQPARAWVDLTQRSASAGAAGAGEPARVTLSLTPYPQAYWVRLRAETASAGKAVRTGELVRVRATVGRTGSAQDDPARLALRLRLGPSLRAVPAGEAPKAYQVSADGTEVLWLWDPLQPGQQREFTVVAVRVAGAAQRRQAEISASVEQTGAEREGREGELPSAVLASATVRLALEPEVQRAVVMGRVVGPDGQGLEGAWVHWEGGAGVQTGPGGWFTLSVPAGPHRLWVTRGVSHSPQAAGTPPGGGSAASPDALTVAQAGSWVVAEPGGLVPVVLAVNTGGSGEPGPATGGGFTGQPQPTWAVAAGQLQWDGSSGADGWAGLSAATALGGLGVNGSGRWGPQGLEWAQVRAGLGSARVVYRSDGLASEPERPGSGLSVPEELSAHVPAFSDGAELEAAWAGSRGFGLLRWQGPGSGRPGETVWLSAWQRARAGEWWAGAGRYPAAGTAQEYRLRWVAGIAGEKPRGYRLSAVLDGPEGNLLGQASGLVQAGVAAAPQAQGVGSLLARLSVRHGWGEELPRLLGPAADELDRLADLVAGAGQDPSGSYRRYTEVRLATTQQVTLGLRRAAAGPVQGTDRAAMEDAHADFYFQPGEEGEPQAQEGGTAAASDGSWAQAPSRPLMRVRLGMLSVQGIGASGPPDRSRWQPYGGMSLHLPSVPVGPGWTSSLGLAGVITSGTSASSTPAGSKADGAQPWGGRMSLWSELWRQPGNGMAVRLRASFDGAVGDGAAAAASPDRGLHLRADLSPAPPWGLSVAAGWPQGRWKLEEVAIELRRAWGSMRAAAGPSATTLQLRAAPQSRPWHASVEASWPAQAPEGLRWELSGGVLASRWMAGVRSWVAPGHSDAELYWAALPQGAAMPASAQALAQADRAEGFGVKVAWSRSQGFGQQVQTVWVQPSLRRPVKGAWSVRLEGVAAVQQVGEGQSWFDAWAAVAAGYSLPGLLEGWTVELGYRLLLAGCGTVPGWFVRVGGWSGWGIGSRAFPLK